MNLYDDDDDVHLLAPQDALSPVQEAWIRGCVVQGVLCVYAGVIVCLHMYMRVCLCIWGCACVFVYVYT